MIYHKIYLFPCITEYTHNPTPSLHAYVRTTPLSLKNSQISVVLKTIKTLAKNCCLPPPPLSQLLQPLPHPTSNEKKSLIKWICM